MTLAVICIFIGLIIIGIVILSCTRPRPKH